MASIGAPRLLYALVFGVGDTLDLCGDNTDIKVPLLRVHNSIRIAHDIAILHKLLLFYERAVEVRQHPLLTVNAANKLSQNIIVHLLLRYADAFEDLVLKRLAEHLGGEFAARDMLSVAFLVRLAERLR